MKTVSLLLLLVWVAACTRKPDVNPLAQSASVRLVKRLYYADPSNPSAVQTTEYQYNEQNQIQEIVTREPNGMVYEKLVFRWLASNRLRVEQHYSVPPWSATRVSNQPPKPYFYTETLYDADTTIRERKYYVLSDDKAKFNSSARYTYDARKRINRRDSYDPNNQLLSSATFTYDNRGNLIQASGSPVVYAYDTAPNPYKPIRVDSEIGWFISPNNIVGIRSVNPTTGKEEEERYRYEYRADGYPIRMIYPDGRKEEFVYNQ